MYIFVTSIIGAIVIPSGLTFRCTTQWDWNKVFFLLLAIRSAKKI